MIKILDGSDIDFSWVYCCQFKEWTTSDDLLRAMREAIKYDWIDYHNKNCNFQILCKDCNLRKKKT